MELNKDCIRDILLECESRLILDDFGEMNCLSLNEFQSLSSKYGIGTVKYTVKKLSEAQLLDARILNYDGVDVCGFYIYDITYIGHEFLDNVRDDKNWKNIKEVAKKIGSTSVQSLVTIATALITEIIKQKIGE